MSGLWLPHDLVRKHYLERLKKDVSLINTEHVLFWYASTHSKHPESTFSISWVFLGAKGFLCHCCSRSTCVMTTSQMTRCPPCSMHFVHISGAMLSLEHTLAHFFLINPLREEYYPHFNFFSVKNVGEIKTTHGHSFNHLCTSSSNNCFLSTSPCLVLFRCWGFWAEQNC